MLAAVRERTTEIGLRKAVGATDRMILGQFLLESVCISLLGVAIGSLVGLATVNVSGEDFPHSSGLQRLVCQPHGRDIVWGGAGDIIRIVARRKSQQTGCRGSHEI